MAFAATLLLNDKRKCATYEQQPDNAASAWHAVRTMALTEHMVGRLFHLSLAGTNCLVPRHPGFKPKEARAALLRDKPSTIGVQLARLSRSQRHALARLTDSACHLADAQRSDALRKAALQASYTKEYTSVNAVGGVVATVLAEHYNIAGTKFVPRREFDDAEFHLQLQEPFTPLLETHFLHVKPGATLPSEAQLRERVMKVASGMGNLAKEGKSPSKLGVLFFQALPPEEPRVNDNKAAFDAWYLHCVAQAVSRFTHAMDGFLHRPGALEWVQFGRVVDEIEQNQHTVGDYARAQPRSGSLLNPEALLVFRDRANNDALVACAMVRRVKLDGIAHLTVFAAMSANSELLKHGAFKHDGSIPLAFWGCVATLSLAWDCPRVMMNPNGVQTRWHRVWNRICRTVPNFAYQEDVFALDAERLQGFCQSGGYELSRVAVSVGEGIQHLSPSARLPTSNFEVLATVRSLRGEAEEKVSPQLAPPPVVRDPQQTNTHNNNCNTPRGTKRALSTTPPTKAAMPVNDQEPKNSRRATKQRRRLLE